MYFVGYVTLNSVKPLYFIICNINGYIEESNGNKYLTLVLADESKDKLENYEEIYSKIKDLIRSTNNNSDDYG